MAATKVLVKDPCPVFRGSTGGELPGGDLT